MKHLLPKLKNLGAPLALITLLLLPGLGWGQTAVVTARPTHIDLSSTTSESAVLMTLSGYASNDARYRLYNGSNQYNPWDEASDAYITSTAYASGPQVPGTPTTSTTFWIVFQRGNNNATAATYRDRLGAGYSSNYRTVALPDATSITSPFSLTGTFTGSGGYDNTVKHVVLGFNGATIVTAASTSLSTGAFTLVCPGGTAIDKIEVRAIDNTSIANITGSWTTTTNVGNIPAGSTPTITVSSTTLTGFNYVEGSGPSTAQSFNISGSDLTADISIAASTNYEISETEGSGYTTPITLTQSGGTVNETTIYVRLKAGLSAGDYNNETITASSSGATDKTVTCSGNVTAPPDPEPSNHVTDFMADLATPAYSAIDVVWTDATGTTEPAGYVIKSSAVSYEDITAPVDGTEETAGPLVKIVAPAEEEANFTGLSENTTYYFKIWPFTNSGSNIDYKTDGTVPQDEATTTYGIPAAPVATTATNAAANSFTANWEAVAGATGYRLDVYTKTEGTNASDLFISEYGEGSGGNKKYVEIYNGTGNSVDLLDFTLKRSVNGGGWESTAYSFPTSTSLLNNSTFVLANNATDVIGANAYSSAFCVWNGDDAIGLFKNDVLIDVIGAPDIDPGSGWPVAGVDNATVDRILIRKTAINSPNMDWASSAGTTDENSQWIVSDFTYNSTDQTTNLGSHTMSGGSTQSFVSGFENLDAGDVTSYSVTGLTPGVTYYYVVRAYNASGTSDNSNEISVTTPLPVYTLLGAEDAAANYSSWANNDNEGCGFEAWNLSSGGNAGFFLGNPGSAGINGLPDPSFGLYANPAGSNYADANRSFVAPLSIGSTLSVTWGVNYDSDGSGNKGINLYTGGISGTQIININMGGNAAITIEGNPMFNNYGTSAMTLNFEYVSAGNLRVYGTGRDGSETYDQTIVVAGAPDAIRFYASGLAAGDERQPYFNNLQIVTDPSGIPAASSVFVKGCVELAEDLEVEDLTIEAGNTLQVDAGFDLTVNGTFDNQSDASALVLKSDASATASLIHGTADVPATVERYITAATWETAGSGWHLLSSPVAAQSISGDWTPTGAGNDYDFYAFDETATTEYWLNQKVGANNITAFIPGKGYLVAYQQTDTKTFSGNLNVADVTLSGLTNTGTSAYPGWHLAGNPFASAINWGSGTWTKTNINAVAQVWSSADGSYKTTTEQSDIIPAMNGFMVYTTGSGELTIPADAREHNAANWYKSDEEFILLKANDPEGLTSQSSIVRFNPSATEAYDADFDAYFLAGFAPMFYSVSGSSLYALNTLPAVSNELAIPFGFVKNSATNYNIELAKNIPATIVYLTDIKTGTVTNLTDNGAYHFTAAEGDDANRFTLHFGTLGMDDPSTAAPVHIYAYGGVVYLNGLDAKASVTITDLTGRVVMAERVNGNGLAMLNAGSLPKGVYVVTAVAGSQVVSAKVIL